VNTNSRLQHRIRAISQAALLSVSTIALGALMSATESQAQTAPGQQGAGTSQLPPVQVTAPEAKRRSKPPSSQKRADTGAASRRARSAQRPSQQVVPVAGPPPAFAQSQDARTGTVGVYANSTSVATKTNTPLVNIPQSVNVLTKDFIRDQSFQSIDDAVRYVPGVIPHQGEGNRDELIIRGVDSSANFFVNGFRDDVQYFRDLYNTQSIEILKGPSAVIFGRGAFQCLLRRQRHVPRFRQARTLRHQSHGDAGAERHHEDQAELRILPR
jgi:catecholate siderophore receptor